MRISRRLLAAGAIAGLALAFSGAVEGAGPLLSLVAPGVLARVGGVPIRESDLSAALERLGAGARPDAALRAETLERLVDEELLVQRAAALGLFETDREVRKRLVRAAIDAAVLEAGEATPGEAELRAFHAANPALFTPPTLLRVRLMHFSDPGAPAAATERAERAAAAIAGGMAFDEAARRFGDADAAPLPDALLPESVLRRHLGPVLTEAAIALGPGERSAPVRSSAGIHLLEVAEVRPGRTAAFEEVRQQVQAELMRRRGDEALRALRARLRARANLVYAPDAPRT